MVIAHVLSSFHVGGQERVALALGTGQRARGHRVIAVSLAAPPEGPLGARFREAGMAAHTVPKRGPTLDPTLPVRLAALLRREGVDVVHTHNPQPLIYAGLAARATGAAVVQTRHGVAFHSGRQVWLARQAARLADAVVVVSRELADTVSPLGLGAPERVAVIENGVDLARFHPDDGERAQARRALALPLDAQVIGTVSRLVPGKDVPGLVRACAPLLGERRRLVIAGDGPARAEVVAAVAACGSARFVHLLGAREDVPRVLRAFDLFALFSRTEGHPIVVLEAMATALPVVATAVGGIPGILDERAGTVVAPGDEAALRAALAGWLDGPERLVEAGRHARELAVARYSVERMVDDYLALYARLRPAEEGVVACSVSR